MCFGINSVLWERDGIKIEEKLQMCLTLYYDSEYALFKNSFLFSDILHILDCLSAPEIISRKWQHSPLCFNTK